MRTPKMSFEQQGKFGSSAESAGELWGKIEAKVEVAAANDDNPDAVVEKPSAALNPE